MKKLLAGFLTVISLTTMAAENIATINEKGSARQIIIQQEKNEKGEQDIVYLLKDRSFNEELNRVSYSSDIDGMILRGKYQTYNFRILNTGLLATASYLNWCWVQDDAAPGIVSVFGGAVIGGVISLATGGAGLLAAAGGAVAVCGVGPVVPAVLGAALLPLDAVVTGVSSLTSPKAIANRKLQKAMAGNNKQASNKVFNLIVKRVKAL